MKKLTVPNYVLFLFKVFFVGMLLSSFFRLTLFLLNFKPAMQASAIEIFYTFFNRGLLFDAYINGVIIALPFLLLSITYLLRKKNKGIEKFVFWYLVTMYTMVIVISFVDIPYFFYYKTRVTKVIFYWFDTAWKSIQVVLMTKQYYPIIFFVSIFSFFFGKHLMKIYHKTLHEKQDHGHNDIFMKRVGMFFVGALFVAMSIHGDCNPTKKQLRTIDVFFCNNAFIHQIAMNPMFSFADSFRAFQLQHLSNTKAIKNTQKYLGITPQYTQSPIARQVTFDEPSQYKNVVIVLVESLCCAKMKRFGYDRDIMPRIEQIADEGILFTNSYSAGTHTHNGIFATLFGLATIMKNKSIHSTHGAAQKCAGISNILRKNGYQTVFLCTGDKNFDNKDQFLKTNDFEELLSDEDYPPDSQKTMWGVYDHVLYDESLKKIDMLHKKNKPFLAVILTVSAHRWNGFSSVEGFTPRVSELHEDKLYEYSDWALGEFMDEVEKKPWYDDTLFVFTGDHGVAFDTETYEMSLPGHHVPLIIKASFLPKGKENDSFCVQEDVFPTIMGILRIPYVNNTLGIDLFREKRPYAFFSSEYNIGCIDDEYFFIMNKNGKESLHRYREKDTADYVNKNPERASLMKDYACSMLQTSQWLIDHKKTGVIN